MRVREALAVFFDRRDRLQLVRHLHGVRRLVFFFMLHSIFTILKPSGKSLPSAGRPCRYAFIITSFATITFSWVSVWLTATTFQFSYPRKSPKERLPNVSAYLSCCAMAMSPKKVSDATPIKANAMIFSFTSNLLRADIPQMTRSSGHLASRLPAIQRHLQRRECRRRIALTSRFQGAVKSAPPSRSSRPIHGVAPALSAGVRADRGNGIGRSRLGAGIRLCLLSSSRFRPMTGLDGRRAVGAQWR